MLKGDEIVVFTEGTAQLLNNVHQATLPDSPGGKKFTAAEALKLAEEAALLAAALLRDIAD